MKFTLTTKEAVAALKTVAGISQNNMVSLTAKGKTLRIASAGKTNTVAVKIPVDVETPGSVTLESFMFAQVIKNRAKAVCEVTESQILIKGVGKLVIAPLEEVPTIDKSSATAVPPELHAELLKLIASVAITPIHDTNPLSYRVALGPKGLSVSAADKYHVAQVSSTRVKAKKEIQFSIPAEAFTTLASLAQKDGGYEFSMTESEILAWSPTFEVRMPTVSDDGTGPTLEAVSSLVSKLRKSDCKIHASVDVKSWYSALDTMEGIFETGANVQLTTVEKGLELKFVTSYGEVKNVLKVEGAKGKFKHLIDLQLTKNTFWFLSGKTMKLCTDNGVLYVIEDTDEVKRLYFMFMIAA